MRRVCSSTSSVVAEAAAPVGEEAAECLVPRARRLPAGCGAQLGGAADYQRNFRGAPAVRLHRDLGTHAAETEQIVEDAARRPGDAGADVVHLSGRPPLPREPI